MSSTNAGRHFKPGNNAPSDTHAFTKPTPRHSHTGPDIDWTVPQPKRDWAKTALYAISIACIIGATGSQISAFILIAGHHWWYLPLIPLNFWTMWAATKGIRTLAAEEDM